MISQRAVEAIEYSDTDELLREVDGLCESSDWDGLVGLKVRCREAVGRGKQLWGVEEHIRYRLTLEAPAPWAAAAINEGDARFVLGPLPEVAASTKTWTEMSPHLDEGPGKQTFAAERVVRGDHEVPDVLDLPNLLRSWEPSYPTATYKAEKVEAPSPDPPTVTDAMLPTDFELIDDPHSDGALTDLVQPWATESNGRYQITCVAGDALAAIRALGLTRARVGQLTLTDAVAWMGWAGASGGAHGRRRGTASGRYSAWWVIATLTDLDWPVDAAEFEEASRRLRFFWFDDGSPSSGWVLRMAIEDSAEDMAWAVSAVDKAD